MFCVHIRASTRVLLGQLYIHTSLFVLPIVGVVRDGDRRVAVVCAVVDIVVVVAFFFRFL